MESLLTQTLIIHIIRTAKIPFIESRASSALDRNDDHHLRNRDHAAIHLAVGTYSASRPYRGSTGPWSLAMLLTYAVLTHFVKVWFIRRWGL